MKLVDANVLLYAVNVDAERHDGSRRWLDAALSGRETIAFAWVVVLAFLRLSTRVGLFPSPLRPDDAMDRVEAWLAAAPSVIVEPTAGHSRVMRDLLRGPGTGGNLINDAHLAALAVEHRCVIVSFDRDFDRFDGVQRFAPDSGP